MRFKGVACSLLTEKKLINSRRQYHVSHSFHFCIDVARTFQKKLLNLFNNRSYASLQLVEALAHASKPTTVVELSQETPFERSYSVINKVLDTFGEESLVTKTVNAEESEITVRSIDPASFSKITKPFSDYFFEMLPQEVNRKFRLFALDATSTPRIHAHTLDDRSYVHQANQIGVPVTVGLEASVLTYLPEYSTEEANWQLPVSLERISTDTTACKVAKAQLQLLAESTIVHTMLRIWAKINAAIRLAAIIDLLWFVSHP